MGTSTRLAALTQTQLSSFAVQAQTHIQEGQLPNYIPLLFQTNPSYLAVQVQGVDGQIHVFGDATQAFVLMSVIKPFALLCLLEELGDRAVFSRVGLKPSEQPFNSLTQLEADQGWPRNPMINSGAIVLADLLPGSDAPSRTAFLCQWLNQRAGTQLRLDEQMLHSVRSAGGKRNREIAALLMKFGQLKNEEMAIDTYNQICCLSGTVADLAKLGMLLTQCAEFIRPQHRRLVNALMMTCGLYEASGEFAVRVGLPTKSGVSGALLSVVPSQGAIACYSPTLDQAGNSVAGLFLLEQLTQFLDLSVFS